MISAAISNFVFKLIPTFRNLYYNRRNPSVCVFVCLCVRVSVAKLLLDPKSDRLIFWYDDSLASEDGYVELFINIDTQLFELEAFFSKIS